MERADAHFTVKITEQSNIETHEAEEILEGESLLRGALGVDERHDDAGEHATIPHRAEWSCLVGITFFFSF